VSEQPTNGTNAYRLGLAEKRLEEVEHKVDRLILAIVGASLTFTISALVFAITLVASGGGSP